jgi:hypothetical protein
VHVKISAMLAIVLLAVAGCGKGEPPSFAGTWLPDARRARAWPDPLPLTPTARAVMASFDPAAGDPTRFCMPLGTPRNLLQTQYPLEIVQTPGLLVMVLQPNLANAEVRRIPLDGRTLPDSPDPTWYGTSSGRWEGTTLVVETVGLRTDAPLNGDGLTHSEQLRVVERLSIVDDAEHGRTLIDDIELHDPKAYLEPLRTRRYFAWAPQATLREGSCVENLWIDKLWRDRLQEHAESARKTGASR